MAGETFLENGSNELNPSICVIFANKLLKFDYISTIIMMIMKVNDLPQLTRGPIPYLANSSVVSMEIV